jgi:hypothetical protein
MTEHKEVSILLLLFFQQRRCFCAVSRKLSVVVGSGILASAWDSAISVTRKVRKPYFSDGQLCLIVQPFHTATGKLLFGPKLTQNKFAVNTQAWPPQ